MFKFLLIVGIVAYLLYKIGSFFFRAGAAAAQLRNFQEQQKKGFTAEKTQPKKPKNNINGGEYIDYEEIKKK